MEGADIYQIAKTCRTSVEMIEKYYASHIKSMPDANAINVVRPKRIADRPRLPHSLCALGGAKSVTYSRLGIAGVAEPVDATDLSQIECSRGNPRCRTAQIRGTLSDGDPEPSPGTKAPRKV